MLIRGTLTQRGPVSYIKIMRHSTRNGQTDTSLQSWSLQSWRQSYGSATHLDVFDSLFKNGNVKLFDDQYQ
jgi:hypothetical protein